MEETMFLGLRMTRGVSLSEFEKTYGQTMEEVYGSVIERNIRDGLLEYRMCPTGMKVALTEKGLDVSNYVMSDFIM